MSSESLAFLHFLLFRPLFNQLAEQVERLAQVRRPKQLPDFQMETDRRASLYKTSSIDEMTEEKLSCAVSILPQVDPLPNMFTYVSLQRNFLVRFLVFVFSSRRTSSFQCDTVTNLSDLLLDEDDEDVKLLLNSVQSEGFSASKRMRRSSKSSTLNDRNNEMIFDEEHLTELLKRLKQQNPTTSSEDEVTLFDTLISELSSNELLR